MSRLLWFSCQIFDKTHVEFVSAWTQYLTVEELVRFDYMQGWQEKSFIIFSF